jgi:hypothetical protein
MPSKLPSPSAGTAEQASPNCSPVIAAGEPLSGAELSGAIDAGAELSGAIDAGAEDAGAWVAVAALEVEPAPPALQAPTTTVARMSPPRALVYLLVFNV